MVDINELVNAGKIDKATDMVFDALLGVINAGSNRMHISRESWKVLAPELVKKMQDPTGGEESEKTPEPGDDIEILTEKAELVITYEDKAGKEVAPKVTKKIFVGSTYNVASPVIEGFTPDKAAVTGTMTKDGATAKVVYDEEVKTARLYITYEPAEIYEGFVAPTAVEEVVTVGEEYSVTSPVIEGYTPDKEVVSGTMVEEGVEELVIYTKDVEAETPDPLVDDEES